MTAERHEFQTETRSLLRLMIHSLYSNKEIFLRELISNASDACDKLRFAAIQQPDLIDGELFVELQADKFAGTLTIRDNGIGMSRDEVLDNLGTIARSGTKKFMESLSGDQAKDAQLIGQFGVGFYSAFLVADKVTVKTRRADGEATVWESTGEGDYTLEAGDKTERGTEVILHLRDDEKEFLEAHRLQDIVRKYSDHIGLPIKLRPAEGEPEAINQARALWTRPKSEIGEDDYKSFYEHLTHDFEAPLAWAHHKVEGNLEYTSLLYIPARAPFDLWDRDQQRGVKLYVKRVFIMDRAAELLPPYLRFVRGLVDTADLPLNVSREILQGNRTVDKIRSALVKRVLDLLDDLAANRPDDYARFYEQFGKVLKEGIIDDHANRERIAKLLRFNSTTALDKPSVGLEDYIARMPETQEKILYLTGESLGAIRNSPHLEGFRKAGFEVLLLADRIDEWVVGNLTEYQDKKLESAARGNVEAAGKIDTADQAKQEAEFKEVLAKLPEALGHRIASARVSARLTESPSCLVAPEHGMSRQLLEILKQAGQDAPDIKPILELNAEHPLVARLKDALSDEVGFADLAEVLHGQAVLAEGGQLDDPAGFVKRLNKLILGQGGGRILLG
ncbi:MULTISPECIES: molecular chaperone HtpG [Hydrocarboniphaga]|uniref:Chaperone protein HtpG n=1 Tax=Hydrocarboniphaga effusa AP103 TaxID=1172194 RepID=I7Z8B2_9GAMM|nr:MULTISPECIES: molecular chaperone HtpG [Hydrocarboniphaga]EIT68039.1 heat shock protein 90 [Hydrocarboniphaga effusa AP103]MDZ4078157.1 molecular chaperone HtpG [Hydrocarboniphaga sp.]